MFPWGSTLNLAMPVALVLTGGDKLWLDKLAVKLICCANTGINIIDMDKIQRDAIGMYLPIGNNFNRFIFRDIQDYFM